MTNIIRSYTPGNILQGPVDAYLGFLPPPSSLTPTADGSCITLDANGQPGIAEVFAKTDGVLNGFHLGSLDGPTSIQIVEKCNEIDDGQHESPIDIGFDSIEAEIDLIIKETNLYKLRNFGGLARLGTVSPSYKDVILADSPSLYLPLSEQAGPTAFDLSGNGSNGVYSGSPAPTFGVPGPLIADPAQAVYFTDQSQAATVPNNALLNPGDTFTLELCFKPIALIPTFPALITKAGGGIELDLNNDGSVTFRKYGGSSIAITSVLSGPGSWYHLAITKATSTTHMYLNAADVTTPLAGDTIVSTTSPFVIGPVFDGINCVLGQVALYPTALSAGRVQAHFAAMKTNWLSNLGQQALELGGQFDSSMRLLPLLLVSPDRTTAGKFIYTMAYATYLKSAIPIAISRKKETVYKLKFGCVMDLSRVQGDELMQIVRTK